ncbi:MAG: ubiquitin-like domain-containing protein [Nitrososphaeria archaeon]
MTTFLVSVDYSNSYSPGRGFRRRSITTVNVSSETTIGQIKEAVLKFLNIPYEDLYFIEYKGRRLEDKETVSSSRLSKGCILVLGCKDFNELYTRMGRDGRL